MGRRGHHSFGRGLLGATLGPLGVFTALGAARHENEQQPDLIAPAMLLLYGHPSRALVDFAIREGYGLVVVGTRGGGLSDTLLGSPASALASGCPVPVLMAGDPAFASLVA